MKQIAEKEFPAKAEGVPFLCDSEDINRFKQEGYKLASTHWAAFMEWALFYGHDFEYVEGLWLDLACEHDTKYTTTELFEYWYNNVKDKP